MTQNTPSKSSRGGIVAGTVLILVGLTTLLFNVFQPSGELFMAILAAGFILPALFFRRVGLAIPGGILAGIAVGIWLVEGPYSGSSETTLGGVFMLAMAGGFVLVTLLSWIVTQLDQGASKIMAWAFIPAGFLALIGGLLLLGNLRALELLGQGWPIVMIAIGLYLVFRRRELQS